MARLTKKQFLLDVRKEIELLSQKLTVEEKRRLDIQTFNPKFSDRCIYGQITGDCRNNRAQELISDCCQRVWNQFKGGSGIRSKTFSQVRDSLNGQLESGMLLEEFYDYLSALEGYIMLKNAKNEEIISYLKGETKTLKL